MPRTVTYRIHDEADGRFTAIATMEPNRVYRREGFATLAEAEDWIEGLRILMAACGAPLARGTASGDPVGDAEQITLRRERHPISKPR